MSTALKVMIGAAIGLVLGFLVIAAITELANAIVRVTQ